MSEKLVLQVQTQRPIEVPIHYDYKLNSLLDDLQKQNGLIKEYGTAPHEKPAYRTIFLNPLIVSKKNDSIKFVLDCTHSNQRLFYHLKLGHWNL